MNSSSSSTEFQQDTIEENATERNMVGVGLRDIPLDSNTNNNLFSASSYAQHQRSFQESSHQQMPSAASAVGDLPASLLLQLQQRQQKNQMQLDLLQQQERRNEMGEQQLVVQQLLQLTDLPQRMQLLQQQQRQQQQAPMLLNHVLRNSGSSSFDGTVPTLTTGNDKNDLLRSLTSAALQLGGKTKISVSTCTNGSMPPSNDFMNNITNFTAGDGFNFPIATSSSAVDLSRSHRAADLLSSRLSAPSNIVLNRVISRLGGVAVPGLEPPAQESYHNDSTTNNMVADMVADMLTTPGTATRKRKAPNNKNRVRRKKPKDHPSRPLSAYNLFFKDERRRILGIQGEDDEKLPDSGENTTSTDAASKTSSAIGVNKEQDESDRYKAMKSGPDSKISGIAEHATTRKKVGFENLAKEIGARWRKITPERLAYYKAIAMKDQQRYTKEMKVREEKLIQLREEEKKILKDAAQQEQKEKEEELPKRVTIQKEGKKEEEDGHTKKNQEAANEGDECNGAEDKALFRGDKEIHHATENGGNPMATFVSTKRQCSSSFVENSTSSDPCIDDNQNKGDRDSSITIKEPAITRNEPSSSEIQELTASAPAAAGGDYSFPGLPPNEIVLNLPAQDTNGIDLNLPAQYTNGIDLNLPAKDTNLSKLAQEIKNLSDLQELCATTNNTSPHDQLHNSFIATSIKNQEHQDGNTLQSEQIKLHLQQQQLLNTLKNSQKIIGGGGGDTSINLSRSCAIQEVLEQSTMQRQYEDLLTSQQREKLNDRNSHHLLYGLSAAAVGTNARLMPSLLEQQLASLLQSQLNQHPGDLISNATKEEQQSNHQQDSLQRLLQQNMMLAGLTATRSAATEHPHTLGLLYGDGTTTNSAPAISGGGQVERRISGATTLADILHFGNVAGRNATTRGFKNSSILGTNNMNHHLLTNNALKESGVGMSTSTEQHHGQLDTTNAGRALRNREIDLLLHRLLSEGGQNKSGDSNQQQN